MLLYSFGTQQIVLLLINKSGNMFQLIEPLSGQIHKQYWKYIQ